MNRSPLRALPKSPTRLALALLVSGAILIPSTAAAQRLKDYFDLGERRTNLIKCDTDSSNIEAFPPDAFGIFPPGSWVWERITEVSCDEIRWPEQVCWNGSRIRSFRIEFSDAACGCGGFVVLPSTLTLTYDPEVVAAKGVAESDLRLVYNDPSTRGWRPVPGAVPDVTANTMVVRWSGEILGVREFAIVTPAFVPVVPQTWSRIKSLLGE